LKYAVYQRKHFGDALLTIPLINLLADQGESEEVYVICNPNTKVIFENARAAVNVVVMPSSLSAWVKFFFLLRKIDYWLLPHRSKTGLILGKLVGSKTVSEPIYHWLFGGPTIIVKSCLNGPRHIIDRHLDFARVCGIFPSITSANLDLSFLSSKQRLVATEYLVVHPGSRWMFKSPRIEFWKTLLSLLTELGLPILLTGQKEGEEGRLLKNLGSIDGVDARFVGRTNIPELVSLIENASGFLGVDTFAAHIASGTGRRGIVLFGPTCHKTWGPYSDSSLKVMSYRISCRPCLQDGCAGSKKSQCLDYMDPNEVASEFRGLFET
jgi:heptosyltransferase-3